MKEKNVKITKRSHAFIGYASFYNVEVQLKDTASAIKNKLKDLLSELKVL